MTLARKMVLGGLPAAYPGSFAQQRCKAAPASAQALVLAVVRHKAIGNRMFDIRSITWDECSYPRLLLH